METTVEVLRRNRRLLKLLRHQSRLVGLMELLSLLRWLTEGRRAGRWTVEGEAVERVAWSMKRRKKRLEEAVGAAFLWG